MPLRPVLSLIALMASAAPALAQAPAGLDPATAAMAQGYARDARACMDRAAAAAVRDGQNNRAALVINLNARCGPGYASFLTAHGVAPRQASAETTRMAGEIVDARLAAGK